MIDKLEEKGNREKEGGKVRKDEEDKGEEWRGEE